MYALRERRQHVTQEDFEFAVAKVRSMTQTFEAITQSISRTTLTGSQEEPGGKHVGQQTLLVILVYRIRCATCF